jgi:hypothetical protein
MVVPIVAVPSVSALHCTVIRRCILEWKTKCAICVGKPSQNTVDWFDIIRHTLVSYIKFPWWYHFAVYLHAGKKFLLKVWLPDNIFIRLAIKRFLLSNSLYSLDEFYHQFLPCGRWAASSILVMFYCNSFNGFCLYCILLILHIWLTVYNIA